MSRMWSAVRTTASTVSRRNTDNFCSFTTGFTNRIALRRFAYQHVQRFMRLILFPAKKVVYLRPLWDQLGGNAARVRRWIAAARALGNRWGFGPRHGFRWYSPDERARIPAWVRRRVREL